MSDLWSRRVARTIGLAGANGRGLALVDDAARPAPGLSAPRPSSRRRRRRRELGRGALSPGAGRAASSTRARPLPLAPASPMVRATRRDQRSDIDPPLLQVDNVTVRFGGITALE